MVAAIKAFPWPARLPRGPFFARSGGAHGRRHRSQPCARSVRNVTLESNQDMNRGIAASD